MQSFLKSVLGLLIINGVISEFLRPRFEAEEWLGGYEITNVTLNFVSNDRYSSTRKACYLLFSYNNSNYKVGLVKTDLIKRPATISVDGHKIDTEAVSEQGNLYQSSNFQNGTFVEGTVIITKSGLDGMLKIGNERLVIEPVTGNIPNNRTMKLRDKETFPCIIYRPEDLLNSESVSNGILIDEIFARGKTVLKSRKKRSITDTECSCHFIVDHTFFKNVGNEDVVTSISEVVYMLSEVNKLFGGTDFDGDGVGDNMGFYISHISIYTKGENYLMASNVINSYKYLEYLTKYDLSKFCMGVSFAFRNYNGLLGLAYIASSNPYDNAGGMCTVPALYEGVWYSYNAAILTLQNAKGKRIPALKAGLALSHEFGHAYGSPHDPGKCQPGGVDGYYLMYKFSQNGGQPNNAKFSPCSIGYIYPVIRNAGKCLKSPTAVCGNGVREGDEECDCGSIATCNIIDPCCTPSDVSASNPDPPCTVRRAAGYQCSYASSPCCISTCHFSQPDKLCRVRGECTKDTYCDGNSYNCPQEPFEPNGKMCDSNTKTCQDGKCTGSICSLYNSDPCECTEVEYECYMCCLIDGECVPAFLNDEYIKKPVGDPCRQAKGFCNEMGTCTLQDVGAFIIRANQIFAERSSVDNEADVWMQTHWYYALAGVAILLFLAGVFIATCRQQMDVHTSAFMYGQFMRIQREAEIQKHFIENRQKLIKSKFDAEIEKIEKGCYKMSLPKAVARLKVFFPTVPSKELEKTMKMSSNEEMAVTLLLMKGYAFRKINEVLVPYI